MRRSLKKMQRKELKRFKIKAERSKLFFWVYMYPDLETLRAEANAHNEMIGSSERFDHGVHGLVNSYERIGISEDPEIQETMHPNIGIVRLSARNATTEIVAHELIHAALWLYRKHYKRQAHFGVGCNDREEDFAYLHGELFRDMTNKMYKYGFWGQSKIDKKNKKK